MRVDMPHMPHAEETMPRRITWLGHAKPYAQGHTGLVLHPFAQLRSMGSADPQRCNGTAATGRVVHVQLQWPVLSPSLTSRPYRLRQKVMPGPDRLDPFLVDH